MDKFIIAFYFIGPFEIAGIEAFTLENFSITTEQISGDLWAPPPLQADGSFNSDGKLALLGLGIILMIPKLSEIIKNALQIKDLGYGSAISEAFTQPYGYAKGHPLAREYSERRSREQLRTILPKVEDLKNIGSKTKIGDDTIGKPKTKTKRLLDFVLPTKTEPY